MKIIKIAFIFAACMILAASLSTRADKGSVSPGMVRFSEDSQRAIIMFNGNEELLILATELKAEKETGVLEFIPFPSEPAVKAAPDDTFKKADELIRNKKIETLDLAGISKGGGKETAPVELLLSEKIGLHDITVIKINDISEFTKWAESFFAKKKISVTNDLSGFYGNAKDYVSRGISYFVIDYVTLKEEKKTIEPLAYRFKTDKIYYPLKTSNVVGGEGEIDLVFIIPGSFKSEQRESFLDPGDFYYAPYINLSESLRFSMEISNSAPVTYADADKIYRGAAKFFKGIKQLYLQAMTYYGPYKFSDDLLYDPAKLDPRAFVWDSLGGTYPWETQYYLKPVENK